MVYKKWSAQSKSFVTLFIIAVVGAFASGLFAKYSRLPIGGLLRSQHEYTKMYEITSYDRNNTIKTTQEVQTVDTSDWKTYTNEKYRFSLLHPPTWKVLAPVTKYGFYTLAIDPGPKFDNVKIYISEKEFFAMEGLPFTGESIAGVQARNVQGVLYGIQYNGFYYTFDEGLSMSIKPQFQAMVHSLTFK